MVTGAGALGHQICLPAFPEGVPGAQKSAPKKKTKLGETTITLSGAGYSSGSTLLVEKVIKKPENKSPIQWHGGVHNEELTGSEHEGHRPDGLVEIWWPAEQEPPRNEGKWLQLMDWAGEDPSRSLEQEVELGRSLAATT